MNTDFGDAHVRHWEDAELLRAHERWANADHLYGLSAECGLKYLMGAFGMQMEDDMPAEYADRKHVNGIKERYETYRQQASAGAEYALPDGGFFDGWDVSQRYSHRNDFSQLLVEPHRSNATIVREFVRRARLEGRIL